MKVYTIFIFILVNILTCLASKVENKTKNIKPRTITISDIEALKAAIIGVGEEQAAVLQQEIDALLATDGDPFEELDLITQNNNDVIELDLIAQNNNDVIEIDSVDQNKKVEIEEINLNNQNNKDKIEEQYSINQNPNNKIEKLHSVDRNKKDQNKHDLIDHNKKDTKHDSINQNKDKIKELHSIDKTIHSVKQIKKDKIHTLAVSNNKCGLGSEVPFVLKHTSVRENIISAFNTELRIAATETKTLTKTIIVPTTVFIQDLVTDTAPVFVKTTTITLFSDQFKTSESVYVDRNYKTEVKFVSGTEIATTSSVDLFTTWTPAYVTQTVTKTKKLTKSVTQTFTDTSVMHVTETVVQRFAVSVTHTKPHAHPVEKTVVETVITKLFVTKTSVIEKTVISTVQCNFFEKLKNPWSN